MDMVETSELQSKERATAGRVGSPSATLIHAKGVKKSFGRQAVLIDVDVELLQGEVVLLSGENGSGKTTLLNILTGNLEPDAGEIKYLADKMPRSYRFPRSWYRDLNPWDHFRPEFVARSGIGRTWQDLRLFDSQSVLDNIAIAERNQSDENPLAALVDIVRTSRTEASPFWRAQNILDMLGLASRRGFVPSMLSYGQAKRVAIARAVAADAKVLFLDEPLAGLDHSGIKDLLALLRSLVRDNNLTLVIVEHVLSQLPLHSMVTTVWTLDRGKLTSSDNSNRTVTNNSAGTRPSWVSLLASDDSEIVNEELPRGAVLTRIRPRQATAGSKQPNFEVKDLVVHRGQRLLLGSDGSNPVHGLSFSLQPGETVVLQAPNGWGKTTLLNAIAGLYPVSSGTVWMQGNDVTGWKPWRRIRAGLRVALGAGYLFDNLTVKEILRLVRVRWPFKATSEFFSQNATELSGGQRGLLALVGSTQFPGTRVLLLDEPFSMLDSKNIEKAASLMRPAPDCSVMITVPLTLL